MEALLWLMRRRQEKAVLEDIGETPKGSALAFSMLLRPQIQPENASMLTLVAALAVSLRN